VEGARAAVAEDRDAIVDLAERAIDELEPTRGGAVWRRRHARPVPVAPSVDDDLAAALAGRDRAVLVGTIEDVVVGYAVVRVEGLGDGSTLGVVDDLYVDPEARGVGVGEAVMDLVLDWCRQRGCFGVDALALPGNRATKNFFERFGLTARAILVHRSLSEHR